MPTQLHPEQPPQRTLEHSQQISTAVGAHTQAANALDDLDSLFVAALCVLRVEEGYRDLDEKDKIKTLETLMEYGRGTVEQGKKGLEEVWKVTSGYRFGHRQTAAAETEKAAQEETPKKT
jgi:hypothetical protein